MFTWAELWTTPRNPAALRTSRLARRVAEDLAARGWKLEAVTTDNASEYRSKVFRNTIGGLGCPISEWGRRFLLAWATF